MNKIIYIDIETIPAGDKIDPKTLNPPANMSKKETIDNWYETKAHEVAEDVYRKRALDSMAGEIVCVGWAVDDGEVTTLLDVSMPENEFVSHWVAMLRGELDLFDVVTWVGHNILTFDMAWLWRRGIRYGLPWLAANIRLDRNRGNIEDTMKIWGGADYKDYTSLDNLATWLGCGDKNGSGSEVYDQYMAGDYAAIEEHCKQDVELVRNIYKRIKGVL